MQIQHLLNHCSTPSLNIAFRQPLASRQYWWFVGKTKSNQILTDAHRISTKGTKENFFTRSSSSIHSCTSLHHPKHSKAIYNVHSTHIMHERCNFLPQHTCKSPLLAEHKRKLLSGTITTPPLLFQPGFMRFPPL